VNNDGEIYYNEFDAYCGQWLRNLGDADEIPRGYVDERSICDVVPTDLRGYRQCHFFAGIGIWARALRDAGWSDDWPVWTGSCPCQPFSGAGKRGGFSDERHLWPAWFWHIEHERPDTIFGEQVTGADEWVDLVRGDLEAIGYTFGCVEIPSAGFGQANIRARTYWVAKSPEFRRRRGNYGNSTGLLGSVQIARRSDVGGMGNSDNARLQRHAGNERDQTRRNIANGSIAETRAPSGMADAVSQQTLPADAGGFHAESCGDSGTRGVANASYVRRERVGKPAPNPKATAGSGPKKDAELGSVRDYSSRLPDRIWDRGDPVEWVYCRDEKWRPIEPGTLPLAPSNSSTVGRLRAYGNAINLRTATEFVRAFLDIEG